VLDDVELAGLSELARITGERGSPTDNVDIVPILPTLQSEIYLKKRIGGG
jgi:hypothetical protein